VHHREIDVRARGRGTEDRIAVERHRPPADPDILDLQLFERGHKTLRQDAHALRVFERERARREAVRVPSETRGMCVILRRPVILTEHQATVVALVHNPEKIKHVQSGLTAIDKAISLNNQYMEALVYKNLLLRVQANLERNPARQQALLREAEQLSNRAEEIRKANAAGGSQPAAAGRTGA
jgi:hypothetical protein